MAESTDNVAGQMSMGRALRAKRKELNLTQADVAALLGTPQPNVSAYEKEILQAGPVVGSRVENLLKLKVDSQFARTRFGTLPFYANEIKQALRQDNDELQMRLIIQCSDDFNHLKSEEDINLCLSEPATTGDPRFDALFGGLAVEFARRAKLKRTPEWTLNSNRFLPKIWYFGPAETIPEMRALALRDGIPSLRARNIIFSQRNLESI